MATLVALVAIAQDPPKTHPTWCADVKQYVSIEGNTTHSTNFHLCMDSSPGSLRWSMKRAGVDQYFNGTTRFDVTPNGSSFSCVAKYFGPAQPHTLPWSFVDVDPNATFNRTEHGYDGFKRVNVWTVFRPAKTKPPFKIPAQFMEYRIENTSSTAVKEFLSTTCIQHAFPPSPPGEMQSGVRDFSGNYTSPAPIGSFEPPAGLTCKAAPGSKPFVPDDSCKPACTSGSLCCRDPDAGPGGTCFNVKACSDIHGRAALGEVAFAMDLEDMFGA